MNQKGFANIIWVIIIVTLAVLVAGGGTYFWRESSNKEGAEQFQRVQEENQKLQERVNQLQNQITQLQVQKETPESKEEMSSQPTGTEKAMGYIKTVYESGGKRYLNIDYIQWLTGDEAIKAMREDGKCPVDIYPDPSYCIPNGFYIRNQNPKIRTFEISKDVQISRVTAFDYSPTGVKSISYEELKNLFTPTDSYFKNIPFHIEVVNGLVVKITEQYIP